MLPDLKKRKVLDKEELDQLEQTTYTELLKSVDQHDNTALQNIWYSVPKNVQVVESVLVTYLYSLQKQGKTDIAEPLIRNALKQNWSEELIRLYGVIDSADVAGQLAYAETWLKTRENDAMLLLTLGRLSMRSGLWGKARAYLEASVGSADLAEAYNELGHLLEKMGEPQKALDYFRKGLASTPGCENSISESSAPKELENKSPGTPLIADSSAVS